MQRFQFKLNNVGILYAQSRVMFKWSTFLFVSQQQQAAAASHRLLLRPPPPAGLFISQPGEFWIQSVAPDAAAAMLLSWETATYQSFTFSKLLPHFVFTNKKRDAFHTVSASFLCRTEDAYVYEGVVWEISAELSFRNCPFIALHRAAAEFSAALVTVSPKLPTEAQREREREREKK